jgi:histidine triad (HIT) family protein
MDECVFCSILAGELPAHFVYKDERVIGFLSLEQPNPYKVLVVPREHVETVYDLNDELAGVIFQVTTKIARGVRDVSKCDGMNLVQSNGKAGLQDVFHFHLHIVPRYFEDNIILDWDNTPASQEKLVQIANEIRNGL